MDLLTHDLRLALRANHARAEMPGHDPAPLVKLFNPAGQATWLATELAENGDALFGLADLGFGCPELGWFSLSELERLVLPSGSASSAISASPAACRCRNGLLPPAPPARS